MQLLGIELSQTCLKYIEVNKQKQKVTLKKADLLEINPQEDREMSLNWLQKVTGLKWYHKKKLIIVINTQQTLIRQFLIPPTSEITIQQQLEIKPEIYLPIERGTHQIRFKLLTPMEGEKMLLQLVAIPNTLINDAIRLAKKLNARLISINVPSEATTALFVGQKPKLGLAGQNRLIIDIEADKTQILIIESNGAHVVRYVPFGSKNMQALAQAYFDEMSQKADKNHLMQLLYLQVQDCLVYEIERLFKFYRTRYTHFEIQEFYLISQAKIVENIKLKDYLSRTLNIRFYPIDFIKNQVDDIAPFLYLLGAVIGVNQ